MVFTSKCFRGALLDGKLFRAVCLTRAIAPLRCAVPASSATVQRPNVQRELSISTDTAVFYTVSSCLGCVVCCLLEVGAMLSFTRQTPKTRPLVVCGEGATLYDKFLPEVRGL